jgi:hypothetical protein
MAEGGETRSKTAHRTPSQIKRHGRTYQAKPQQRKNRAARNAARKALGLKKGDPRDAGHKKPLSKGGTNSKSNLKATNRSKNRGHGMTRGKKPNKGR